MNMKKILAIGVFLIIISNISAQDTVRTHVDEKQKKNIIRWNITPMFINVTNLTIGYERIIKKNQSISINVGLLLFPHLLNNDSLQVSYVTHGSRLGFTTAMDYRFYLRKRNKRDAPDGVYIGPYLAYYQYAFDNKLSLIENNTVTNEIGIDANFKMASLGIELGYQFLFWDKMTVDLILVGPSITYYNAKVKLSGELSINEEDESYIYLKEQVLDRYPWIESFISLDAINTGGKFDSFGMGFRYVVQIGYHF